MPPVIQNIAQFLPFQLLRYFPIQLILNKLSPEVIGRNFAMALIWFVAALALFRWVWREGVEAVFGGGSVDSSCIYSSCSPPFSRSTSRWPWPTGRIRWSIS